MASDQFRAAFGEPVDMRKSFNTLSALVVALGHDVLSIFSCLSAATGSGRRCSSSTSRLCLLAKRLDKGRFAAVHERAKEGVLQMTPSELQLFIEGSDAVGRIELTPRLLTPSDLTPRWPKKVAERG